MYIPKSYIKLYQSNYSLICFNYYFYSLYSFFTVSATLSSNLINASVQANRNISYFVATETPNNLDQPVLNWLYQSNLINDSSDGIDLFQNVQGVSTLIIKQADSSFSGQYSIEGSNSAGTYTTISEIQVVDIGRLEIGLRELRVGREEK